MTSPLTKGCALPLSHMGGTGAGEGNRTLVVSLEGFCSTIELHPAQTESVRAERFCWKSYGGGGWIRTIVGVSQQIYSLPPLATRAPLPLSENADFDKFILICQVYGKKFLQVLTDFTNLGNRLPTYVRTSGGGGWIRTIVGVSQQIYSLPPLATRAPLRRKCAFYMIKRYLTIDLQRRQANIPSRHSSNG